MRPYRQRAGLTSRGSAMAIVPFGVIL